MATKNFRSGFTLIELLVVISVIALLVGFSLVAMGGIQRQAKKQESRGMVSALVIAIDKYHNEYGHFPPPANANTAGGFTILSNSTDMTDLLNHLSGDDSSDNLRAKNFLNIKESKDNATAGLTRDTTNGTPEYVVDSFGNPFTLTFNTNYTTLPIPNGYLNAGDQLEARVIIYNSGRDKTAGNNDDIVSWK